MPHPPTDMSAHVGRTPMVQLTRVGAEVEVELFAKLEAFNPGASVKDRIGVAMIEAAEREGLTRTSTGALRVLRSGNSSTERWTPSSLASARGGPSLGQASS
jgi:cysteine synthase